jgi:hypothetical protein
VSESAVGVDVEDWEGVLAIVYSSFGQDNAYEVDAR